jgi:hypothetical protein
MCCSEFDYMRLRGFLHDIEEGRLKRKEDSGGDKEEVK